MTGPFTTSVKEAATFILSSEGDKLCCFYGFSDKANEEKLALAFVGALNDAPTDEPLDKTLERLAQGKTTEKLEFQDA